jgi:hypothetical protein
MYPYFTPPLRPMATAGADGLQFLRCWLHEYAIAGERHVHHVANGLPPAGAPTPAPNISPTTNAQLARVAAPQVTPPPGAVPNAPIGGNNPFWRNESVPSRLRHVHARSQLKRPTSTWALPADVRPARWRQPRSGRRASFPDSRLQSVRVAATAAASAGASPWLRLRASELRLRPRLRRVTPQAQSTPTVTKRPQQIEQVCWGRPGAQLARAGSAGQV